MTSARSPLSKFPFKNSIASTTSSEFPTARPRGSSIEVTTAVIDLSKIFPTFTINLERATASSGVFIKAPEPYLTSIIILEAPEAIFFEIIEDASNSSDSTAAISFLKIYIFLSAGAKSSACDEITAFILFT